MLKPSMQELMRRVGNRYLLVNLTAQRARDLADKAEEKKEPLKDKAVKLALDEIARGRIVYRPGARVIPILPKNNAVAASMLDVDAGEDEDRGTSYSGQEEEDDEERYNRRRLLEIDDEELDDGDIPEEDR